ncbi:MAG: hypothetical protein Q9169_007778 [Polycauliona sp. 2 TL-2023]
MICAMVNAIPVEKTNATLSVNPPPLNNLLIHLPQLHGFEMDFTFDQTKLLRPLEIYQTAIQLMYETVQRGWDEQVKLLVAEEIEGYNVLMMFLNHQADTAPEQLIIGHCVAALYRAIVTMTDRVLFCQLRSHLSIFEKRIGALSIAPVRDALRIEDGNATMTTELASWSEITKRDVRDYSSGTIEDPQNARFSVTFHRLGNNITPKEVSLVVLEAMTVVAPFVINAECREILARSKDGGAYIVIESTNSDKFKFTYRWATRALKILYQQVVVKGRRWGDMWLEINYDGVKFGELRMLRGGGNAVKEAR